VSRPVAIALLALLGLLVGFFAYQLRQGADPGAVPSALIGRPLSPFALPPVAGREKPISPDGLSLADLTDGRVHVVNVFGSWCTSCRLETEALMSLAARSDIALEGIDYKDDPKAGAAFLAELGDPFGRIGFDRAGRTAIDWGVYGAPETFVIDPKGRVVARLAGPITAQNMEKIILPAIQAAKKSS
jgi:cytochrome c biogenesis protein CcmG/thiol:disulfide interchange protein DsbE